MTGIRSSVSSWALRQPSAKTRHTTARSPCCRGRTRSAPLLQLVHQSIIAERQAGLAFLDQAGTDLVEDPLGDPPYVVTDPPADSAVPVEGKPTLVDQMTQSAQACARAGAAAGLEKAPDLLTPEAARNRELVRLLHQFAEHVGVRHVPGQAG